MKTVTETLCILLSGWCLVAVAEDGPPAGQRPDADAARTWAVREAGVELSLTQLLPDQLRAFYVNRGMPLAKAEPYAKACVFMTVLRNEAAPGVVHFRLSDWSIVTAGQKRSPLGSDVWLQRLGGEDLSKAVQIAFRWAQFPAEQEYQPGGDWNQGMLAMDLPADSHFDLIARWDVAGQAYQGVLRDVRCAR